MFIRPSSAPGSPPTPARAERGIRPRRAYYRDVRREEALAELADAVRAGGLIEPGSAAVVMISGGADSACLAAGLAHSLGADAVHASHVNYGLRDGAADGEAACRRPLRAVAHRPARRAPRRPAARATSRPRRGRSATTPPSGCGPRTGADVIATGHTRTDVAETVLYRLAVSPGSRALLGLAPRNGRVVRPLLELERERVRALATAAEACRSPTTRPTRTRLSPATGSGAEVLPVLREVNPAAEHNIAETRAELAEEAELLDRVVLEALGRCRRRCRRGGDRGSARPAGWEPGSAAAGAASAGRASRRSPGAARPAPRRARSSGWRRSPEGGTVELGGGLVAICESGFVRFRRRRPSTPPPHRSRCGSRAAPGSAPGRSRAELHPAPVDPAGPDLATLDAEALDGPVEVRTWREGDRIRPLGMRGTKTLQDLFTDSGVPRSLRATLPVVTVGGEVAWVAGVAVSEASGSTPIPSGSRVPSRSYPTSGTSHRTE